MCASKKALHRLLYTLVILVLSATNTGVINAISDSDLKDLRSGWPAYRSNGDDENGKCATGGGTGGSPSAGETFVAWNSGIEGPYIMEQYIIEVLKYIADFKGAPREDVVTEEHAAALLAFAWGEGGDINNRSVFNLFNTSALRDDPEAMPYANGGGDGRQAYASFDVGIKATGGTMLLPRYTRIIEALLDKNSDASKVLYNYTHYTQFPGNGWWAEQNKIDGEEAYYQKMMGFLRGMKSNYRNRASTIIGTEAYEQRTGARDPSKLVYGGGAPVENDNSGDSSGNEASPDKETETGGDSSSGSGCDDGTPGGRGGGVAEVDGFTFPLVTTKGAIKTGVGGGIWCYSSQANCHHDYNAADIHVPVGTVVIAAKEGTVVLSRDRASSCGSSVVILGSDSNVYYYTHMQLGSIKVAKGQSVEAATPLGQVGEKACGTAPHLHFDMQPPPATNRPGCSGAACSGYAFLNVQPVLIKAYGGLPE